MTKMMSEDDSAEIISFNKAADSHKESRKEARLKKVQKAFKRVVQEKLKNDRIAARKKKPSKKPKKK